MTKNQKNSQPNEVTQRTGILRNQDGVVLIMFGLLINIMVLSVSLSMDLGRGYMARSAIASAADAAVLASAIQGGDVNEAKRYFEANLPSGYLSISYNFDSDVEVTVQNNLVRVKPTGFEVPGFFNTDIASAGAGANLNVGGGSAAALPGGSVDIANFAFIVDVSGSMSGSKIVALRQALQAVVLLLDNANQNASGDTLKMSISAYQKILKGDIDPTDNISELDSFISSTIQAGGSTNGHVGMYTARMEHVPVLPAGASKNVVLMTDGQFNHYGIDTPQSNVSTAHTKVREECDAVKQDPDATMWTIGFGSGASASAATLNYCASTPEQALWASTNQELINQFSSIFVQGTSVRLVE